MLQTRLAREFNTPATSVNIMNGVVLTVVLQDAEAASLPDSDRTAFARRVAEFVRDHYRGYARLHTVNVGFATAERTGPRATTATETPYSFATAELGPAPAPADTAKRKP